MINKKIEEVNGFKVEDVYYGTVYVHDWEHSGDWRFGEKYLHGYNVKNKSYHSNGDGNTAEINFECDLETARKIAKAGGSNVGFFQRLYPAEVDMSYGVFSFDDHKRVAWHPEVDNGLFTCSVDPWPLKTQEKFDSMMAWAEQLKLKPLGISEWRYGWTYSFEGSNDSLRMPYVKCPVSTVQYGLCCSAESRYGYPYNRPSFTTLQKELKEFEEFGMDRLKALLDAVPDVGTIVRCHLGLAEFNFLDRHNIKVKLGYYGDTIYRREK